MIVPSAGPSCSVVAVDDNHLHGAAVIHVWGPWHRYRQQGGRLGRVDAVVIAPTIFGAHVANTASWGHPLLAQPDPILVIPVPAALKPLPTGAGGGCQHIDLAGRTVL